MASDIVLIIEDNEDMRRDLAFLIRHRGYSVETAGNGEDALRKLKELGRPCIILLDLMMPVMDGWELRAELLKDPTLADVPVVLLSGVAELQNEADALKAVDCLKKPVDVNKLYRVIESHC